MDEDGSNPNGVIAHTDALANTEAPGAIDHKDVQNRMEESKADAQEQQHQNDAKIDEDIPKNADNEQQIDTNEEQDKDPREPKLKLGMLSIIGVIGPEWLPLLPALFFAAAAGVAPVLFFVVLGGLFGQLGGSDISSVTNQAALYMTIIAIVSGVLQFLAHFIFNYSSQRIGNRVKSKYFDAVTRQEIGFFDIKKAGAIANSLADDTSKVTDAFSVNLQDFTQYMTQFVVAIILALVYNYAMALLQMIAIPVILVIFIISGRALDLLGRKQGQIQGESISTANEVISSMRTVRSMAGEEKEVKRYNKDLDRIRWIYWTTSSVKGVAFGAVMFTIWGCIALAFYFGGRLIGQGSLDVGNFIRVYGLVLMGIFGLMQAFQVLPELIKGLSASVTLLKVIKRDPAIRFQGGKTLDKIEGLLEFSNVTFKYPSRPKATVLESFNLKIEPGTSVALVGQSGSGKSTIVGLIEKWYEQESGTVTLDGVDIRELDPMWVHRYIGIVQQEPTLFATTIKRNITYAVDTINQSIRKQHKKMSEEELNKLLIPVNDELVEKAAKAANCHDFISSLPDKYNTIIGERGVSMSGGQKQRVAIARAVLQDPRVLLLDEATSALDTKSEALVQDALNKLMVGRTSIVIAHRLTTVQDCDMIVVMKRGKVIETGKHEELLERRGAYFQLAKKQMKLNNSGSSSDLASSVSQSDLSQSDSESEDEGMPITGGQSEEISDESRRDSNEEDKDDKPTQDIKPIAEQQPKKQKKRRGLRKRHHEKKKRREELESFTNEQDIEDPHEPKIRTPLGIFPVIGMEWVLILIGMVGAAMVGTVPIAFYLVLGRVVNSIIPFRNSEGVIIPPVPGYSIADTIATYAGYTAIIAAGAAVGQLICMFFFSLAAERMGIRIKKAYFKSIVKQEMGYFDIKKSGKLLSVLSEDIGSIQSGYATRLQICFQYLFQCVLGIIFALISSWDTALIAMSAVLFLIIVVGLLSLGTSRANRKISELNASALATATEVIGSMRTVRSMGGEVREQNRLHNDLRLISSVALLKGFLRGLTQGIISFIIFADAAFVFYYGGKKVADGTLDAGSLIQVFGFVLFAVLGLSLGLSEVSNIVKGNVAAKETLRALKRKPQIPIKGGKTLDKVQGNVHFDNVTFAYPSRPNTIVLDKFNLEIQKGQHVALVGESGCGKSTIAGLIERFYDPKEGSVIVDGLDLKEADCEWLHRNVAIVSQEPVLFANTIKKNITYAMTEDVPMERIIECAKQANCHDFITQLPNGYDTMIGERGVSMSGGQKQRIAIARAMLQNASLLILDEATSALDTESESLVQDALNKLMEGRTSIVIAHRLSTIQDCDVIIAMKQGKVVEKGNHDELIQKKGMYYRLSQKQMEFGQAKGTGNESSHESIELTEED